jgi:hypothetical protein
MAITAGAKFHNQDLTDIPVLNPDDRFGKAWLIEIGGSYFPLLLIVEADSVSNAIDELAENEKVGPQFIVAEEDLGEYPVDTRHYTGTGQVLDLDHLTIYGQASSDCPFPCRYFGDGQPEDGVVSTEFEHQEAE